MSSEDFNCQRFVETVTEYLENALPLAMRLRCDSHLAECVPCTLYLEQMQQTIRLLGQLIDDTVPVDNRRELLDRFKQMQAS